MLFLALSAEFRVLISLLSIQWVSHIRLNNPIFI